MEARPLGALDEAVDASATKLSPVRRWRVITSAESPGIVMRANGRGSNSGNAVSIIFPR
jgi:hypothetical protein